MRLAAVAIALFLVWFLQGLFFRKFWNRGLEVFLDFQQTAAVEGETAALKEVIVNRKFLPLPVLHVKFQMGRELVFTDTEGSHITDRNYRSDIFSCMPWQEIRRRLGPAAYGLDQREGLAGAALAGALAAHLAPVLPWLMGAAAGTMALTVARQLAPAARGEGGRGAVCAALGFGAMLALSALLG